jgi:hypothetical protein
VLDLLLEPVTVALPAGPGLPLEPELRAGLEAILGAAAPSPAIAASGGRSLARDERTLRSLARELHVARPARIARHDWRSSAVDLPGYAASGLPAETMGRGMGEDPLFFAAALAGGSLLAAVAAPGGHAQLAGEARASGAGALLAEAKLDE